MIITGIESEFQNYTPVRKALTAPTLFNITTRLFLPVRIGDGIPSDDSSFSHRAEYDSVVSRIDGNAETLRGFATHEVDWQIRTLRQRSRG